MLSYCRQYCASSGLLQAEGYPSVDLTTHRAHAGAQGPCAYERVSLCVCVRVCVSVCVHECLTDPTTHKAHAGAQGPCAYECVIVCVCACMPNRHNLTQGSCRCTGPYACVYVGNCVCACTCVCTCVHITVCFACLLVSVPGMLGSWV